MNLNRRNFLKGLAGLSASLIGLKYIETGEKINPMPEGTSFSGRQVVVMELLSEVAEGDFVTLEGRFVRKAGPGDVPYGIVLSHDKEVATVMTYAAKVKPSTSKIYELE